VALPDRGIDVLAGHLRDKYPESDLVDAHSRTIHRIRRHPRRSKRPQTAGHAATTATMDLGPAMLAAEAMDMAQADLTQMSDGGRPELRTQFIEALGRVVALESMFLTTPSTAGLPRP
jgi:hypothetical protein